MKNAVELVKYLQIIQKPVFISAVQIIVIQKHDHVNDLLKEKMDNVVMEVLKKVLESGHDNIGLYLHFSVIGDPELQECIAVLKG